MLHFKTIRYFPSSISDEFFNIGIVLREPESNQPIIKLLTTEQMHQLPCITAENRNVVEKMLIAFEQHNGLLYGNHVRFSKEQWIEPTESIEQEADTLFYQYVTYKLHHQKPTVDKIETIIQEAFDLAKKEFDRYLIISRDDHSFDMIIQPVKKSIIHKTKIGSVNNSEHIRKILWNTETDRYSGNNSLYDFLNIATTLEDKSNIHYSILSKTNINCIGFSDAENQFGYFKKLVH